jgi:hypothetical protein
MSRAPDLPGRVVHDEVVPAGRPWWRVVARGDVLRIVDLEGQQAVDFLCFDAADAADRYSAANTIKIPAQLYVGRGTVLYSDTVTPLMTVIDDTVGGHDTVFGCCSTENNLARYGVANTPSCRRNFLEAFAALGLDASALVSNVNFFMAVPVGTDGRAQIVDGASKPGDYVDLRAERDVLAVLSNCPQTLNPCNGFEPSPIRVVVYRPA